MKTQLSLAIGLAASLVATSAFAQEPAAAPFKALSVSAQVDLMPVGSIDVKFGELEESVDTDFAYGLGVNVLYRVSPMLSFGLAPRYILNVKGSDSEDDVDDEAAKELDLRARVQVELPVAPQLSVFGHVSPGYSIVFVPDSGDEDFKGLVVAFGAGATYDLAPNLYLTGDVSYQLGFHEVDIEVAEGNTVTAEAHVNYLSIGLGAGSRF
jgi:hypothetical protein